MSGRAGISHILLVICAKMEGDAEIASEITGYFGEKSDFEAIWPQ